MNQPTDLEKALIDRKLLELSTIFDNASVGIVFMRGHIIQRCNKRMAEMYGCDSPKELVGQSSVVLYPDEQSYERLGREAAPLLAAGRSFEVDWEFRKRDGSAVWSRLYGKALDPIDPGQGSVWIVEDISEAKRAQEALKQSLGALEIFFVDHHLRVGLRFRHESVGLQTGLVMHIRFDARGLKFFLQAFGFRRLVVGRNCHHKMGAFVGVPDQTSTTARVQD